MAYAFESSPAFSLGLRSPELQDFMWGDKHDPMSPTRGLMGKKPKGSQTFFGPGQVSLRQAQKEHGQAVQSFGLRAQNEKRRQTEDMIREQTEMLKQAASDMKKQEEERAAAKTKSEQDKGSAALYNKYYDMFMGGAL